MLVASLLVWPHSLSSRATVLQALAGRRIRVFWPGDGAWYAGTVSGFDPSLMLHGVDYDDG